MRPKPPAKPSPSSAAQVISTAVKDLRYLNLLENLKDNYALRQEIIDKRMALVVEHGNIAFDNPHSALIHAKLQGQIETLDWLINQIIHKKWLPDEKPAELTINPPKSKRG